MHFQKKYVNICLAFRKLNSFVLVAQLDRVFGYEPKGRGFESLQARQNKTDILKDVRFVLVYLDSVPRPFGEGEPSSDRVLRTMNGARRVVQRSKLASGAAKLTRVPQTGESVLIVIAWTRFPDPLVVFFI